MTDRRATLVLIISTVFVGMCLILLGGAFSHAGVPTYPHAENSIIRVGEDTTWPTARHTSFQTADSPEDILSFYRARLGAWQGWELSPSINQPNRLFFSSTRGRDAMIRIQVQPTKETTHVDVWYGHMNY